MAIKIRTNNDITKDAFALVSILNYRIEEAEGFASPIAVKLLQLAADEISKDQSKPRRGGGHMKVDLTAPLRPSATEFALPA